jgi:hypothetical protein
MEDAGRAGGGGGGGVVVVVSASPSAARLRSRASGVALESFMVSNNLDAEKFARLVRRLLPESTLFSPSSMS